MEPVSHIGTANISFLFYICNEFRFNVKIWQDIKYAYVTSKSALPAVMSTRAEGWRSHLSLSLLRSGSFYAFTFFYFPFPSRFYLVDLKLLQKYISVLIHVKHC